jgi:SSS family solute:Na+ symporter
MSSMSSAMNSIAAVLVTDIYRRHLAPGRDEPHYVRAAKASTLVSSFVMIGGAWLLLRAETPTLQHLWTEFQSILAGGLLGLFLLGFTTSRGNGRSVAIGIACAVLFSGWVSAVELGWLPKAWVAGWSRHFDSYYAGIVGNLLTFVIGFGVALLGSSPPPSCGQIERSSVVSDRTSG